MTFENVQAGLRTDYLFRIANHSGGIVLGTGDLSEFALGWCTYGVGDQMSHYTVNSGVPKTLIQHLIRWVIGSGQVEDDPHGEANRTLQEILDQEITPELIPTEAGKKPQATEDTIGPYALQDFTLFHVLRFGFRPSKIAFLAMHAWVDASAGEWPPGYPDERHVAYDLATIRRWLVVFINRFFGFSQFKRSAMPNGPKVVRGRLALPTRRLAGTVRRQRPGLAGRARRPCSAGLSREHHCARRPARGRLPACLVRRVAAHGRLRGRRTPPVRR